MISFDRLIDHNWNNGKTGFLLYGDNIHILEYNQSGLIRECDLEFNMYYLIENVSRYDDSQYDEIHISSQNLARFFICENEPVSNPYEPSKRNIIKISTRDIDVEIDYSTLNSAIYTRDMVYP